jgi:hypothetical protein
LDYIFLSPEWKVNDAIKLQSKEDALKLPCPFPDQVSKREGWEVGRRERRGRSGLEKAMGAICRDIKAAADSLFIH